MQRRGIPAILVDATVPEHLVVLGRPGVRRLRVPERGGEARAFQWSLRDARDRFAALPSWTVETVSGALHATAEALGLGMGKVAQPMRVAITGSQVSPDIAHTGYLAGQAEALTRIEAALTRIAV